MSSVTEPCVIESLDEATYRGVICPEGSLSNSGAKLILDSPARFRYEQDHPRQTGFFDVGAAAHKRLLGVGPTIVAAETTAKDGTKSIADDWRSLSAREHRDELRRQGTVVLLQQDLDLIEAMHTALLAHPLTPVLFGNGRPEVSLFWRDVETSIMLRGRLDWITTVAGRPIIVDYKTTGESASPADMWRVAKKYRWHMQDSTYREGADTLLGGQHAFVFCVQETKPPFLPAFFELGDEERAEGADLSAVARRTYLDCMTTGQWPGYAPTIHRLTFNRY